MDKVHFITILEQNTQESFKRESDMETENINGLTQKCIMKATFLTAICMEEDVSIGKMAHFMTGSGIIMSATERVN